AGTLGIAAGGLYQTNGLPLSFSGSEFAPIGTDGSEPVWAEFASPSSGIVYRFDPTYITLRIFVGGPAVSDPLAELASGASVTADTLNFKADFNKV
ncbi:MAG: hypothetical protein ACRD22_15475, partial [Terriglobia bacterium]